MARPITSVHVDIAEFMAHVAQVFDVSMEKKENPDKALADWTRRLARALAFRDPKMHPYAAKLLAEVEEFRKADSERKRADRPEDSTEGNRHPNNSKESKDLYNRSEHSDQNRSKEERPPAPKGENTGSDAGKLEGDGVPSGRPSLFVGGTGGTPPNSAGRRKSGKDLPAGGAEVRIIEYLNEKTGKRFRPAGATTKLVTARLKDGFTEEDCKKVIDNKTAQWLNDRDMEKYLRPTTLFQASKMDAYLNEKNGSTPRNGHGQGITVVPDLEFIYTGGDAP